MKTSLTPFWGAFLSSVNVLFAPETLELKKLVIQIPILKIRHLKVNIICMRLCTHIWDKYPHPSNVFRILCIVCIKKSTICLHMFIIFEYVMTLDFHDLDVCNVFAMYSDSIIL